MERLALNRKRKIWHVSQAASMNGVDFTQNSTVHSYTYRNTIVLHLIFVYDMFRQMKIIFVQLLYHFAAFSLIDTLLTVLLFFIHI